MRYVRLIAVLILVCSIAQVSVAAPSIISIATDKASFNSDTDTVNIRYELADIVNGCTVISIFGPTGKVRDLFPGNQSTGFHEINWDGANGYGVGVPDGEYTVLGRLASVDGLQQPKLVEVFGKPYNGDRLPPIQDNTTAVNSSGFVYAVSEAGDEIQVSSPDGVIVKKFGGFGSEESRFGNIRGIAVDLYDNVYLADMLNHRVLVLDSNGNSIAVWDYSSVKVGESYSPVGIGVNSSGYIFTADAENDCVEVFSPVVMRSTKVVVDNTPPSTDVLQSDPLHNGWHNASVSLYMNARDSGSGVKEIDYVLDSGPVDRIAGESTTFLVKNGVHTLEYWSTDNTGNEGTRNSRTVQVDTIPPVTVVTLTGTGGSNGWYRSKVMVNLSADDSGSGVATNQYSFDGSDWFDGASFTIAGEGENTAYFRSIDIAGNVESPRTLKIMIDRTAPSVRHLFEGQSPDGWFTSNVSATLFPTDNISGIVTTEYSLDGISWNTYTSAFMIPQDNENQVFYRTIDKAGNIADGSSYIYFWPTSFPDFYDLTNQTASPTPSPSTIVTPSHPGSVLTPSPTVVVTPAITPAPAEVPLNETGKPIEKEPHEAVRRLIQILKNFTGIADIFP